jgi:hypothetical protein
MRLLEFALARDRPSEKIIALLCQTSEVPIRSSLCLMVTMLRNRAISPVELVEAHLRQIEAGNPIINAFVSVFAESALAEARNCEASIARGEPLGLLHGVPLTVKDSFDIAGQPTLVGSRFRAGHRAAHHAFAVARLQAEGAILLGRTNTPEMLASYETDNFFTGRTNNPWDSSRTPAAPAAAKQQPSPPSVPPVESPPTAAAPSASPPTFAASPVSSPPPAAFPPPATIPRSVIPPD